MQQPLSQRGQKRQQAILEAATETFLQHGYEGTTLNMIIVRAGGSRRSLYDYFGDKQGLINNCMREMLKRLHLISLQYKAATIDSQPENQIKAIIDSNFDISQVNKIAMRVWLDFWSASMHIPELARLQRINDRRLYSNLKHQFLQLMPEDRANIAASGLAALIDGLWLRGGLIEDDGFDRQAARSIAYDYLDTQLELAKPKLQERQNE